MNSHSKPVFKRLQESADAAERRRALSARAIVELTQQSSKIPPALVDLFSILTAEALVTARAHTDYLFRQTMIKRKKSK